MTPRRAANWSALLLIAVLGAASGPSGLAAARPPAPQGAAILAPGQVPHVCAAGDAKFGATGYGPVSGYYFSKAANTWVSAPLCYPLWGNLEMSGPQIVVGGGHATVVAIPNQGSNSATWAVKPPGAIVWEPGGVVKHGCKPTTLTCTIGLPAATTEWQWILVHVSMPRTYFIDSPGEFCAGVHACAGTATNAWTYVGIPPAGTKPPKKKETGTIAGEVSETKCTDKGCALKGLDGVRITASGGPGGTARTSTGADGSYSLKVEKGLWTVTPSKGDREFRPPSKSVSVGGSAEANFITCALAVRDEQSVQSHSRATAACPKLEITVERIKVKGDHGWTQTSGKKYLGNAAVPVGFGQATKDGDFRWQCRSGCFNIRIRVRDAETGRVPAHLARVKANILFLGKSVDPLDRNGTLCEPRSSLLRNDCSGRDVTSQIDPKTGNLDLYYWVPGVVAKASALLTVEVKSKGYPVATSKTDLTIEPNLAFKGKTIVFKTSARNLANTIIPGLMISGAIDLADYCGYLVTAARWIASGVAGWPISQGWKNFVFKAVSLAKAVKSFCGLVETPAVLTKVKVVGGWALYWIFASKFGLPPSGLIGPPSLVSFLSQIVFEYSQFFDAFTGAFKGFYTAGDDLSQVGISKNDTLSLKIYEVSHRRADGGAQDALDLQFTGTKRGLSKPFEYEEYVEDGYFAGCWLNPKLNEQQVIVADNICHTEEEEPHGGG